MESNPDPSCSVSAIPLVFRRVALSARGFASHIDHRRFAPAERTWCAF
ncbi:MAG: hypothetical protein RL518_522, partial [Pseudomonadota bacterium]